MKNKIFILSVAACLFAYNGWAQEHTENESKEPFKKTHSLSLAIGHAHVFEGVDAEGNKKALALPMWAFDYNFQFAPKWGIGLHTDVINETFTVEKNLESGGEGEVVERSMPIAPAIMGVFKPTHHWGFGLGVGGEFAKEENYMLTRAGVEYVAEISKGWEVFGAIQYDFRWDAYDTWTLGLGISKALGKHKDHK
jgi:hypothetical protein